MIVILLAIFVDLVGFGMIVPILPFLTLEFGGDALTGTALLSIYSLCSFVMGPVWGHLSDRIGRRPALAITFFGSLCAYVLLAFSTSLAMVFVARALSGAMGGNVGIGSAALADITSHEDRAAAMGKLGAAFGLGFAFGPGLGGLLSGLGGTGSVFLPALAAAALSGVAAILALLVMPETHPSKRKDAPARDADAAPTPKPSLSSLLKGQGFMLLVSIFLVASMAQSANFSISPFWMESAHGWTQRQVGGFLMFLGLSIAIFQSGTLGRLFKRYGERKVVQTGALIAVAGTLVVLLSPIHVIATLVGLSLITFGLTVAFPGINGMISHSTPPEAQGTALGFSNGVAALGRVAGPLAAGLLFADTHPALPYAFVGLAALTLAIWGFSSRRSASQ
ncbi:MFS transporter [Pseudokordiimonas caeni]|uniref:MFS transporter n=1 Tax=Pseudokordiimonas caeni TaxID=2997908 RepID=UPI002810C2F3|nr:MFS transporter [Pseudokordiimonas caeni]